MLVINMVFIPPIVNCKSRRNIQFLSRRLNLHDRLKIGNSAFCIILTSYPIISHIGAAHIKALALKSG